MIIQVPKIWPRTKNVQQSFVKKLNESECLNYCRRQKRVAEANNKFLTTKRNVCWFKKAVKIFFFACKWWLDDCSGFKLMQSSIALLQDFTLNFWKLNRCPVTIWEDGIASIRPSRAGEIVVRGRSASGIHYLLSQYKQCALYYICRTILSCHLKALNLFFALLSFYVPTRPSNQSTCSGTSVKCRHVTNS